MEDELILLLNFTAFDIKFHEPSCNDHLTITEITDGKERTLMEEKCGKSLPSYGYSLSSNGISLQSYITSTSNNVKFVFRTDLSGQRPGWSVSWSAVKKGESWHDA